jgi:hypothetical protein
VPYAAQPQHGLSSPPGSITRDVACIRRIRLETWRDTARGKINSDPTWDDPDRIAQLVESVAGARRNDQELIDLMETVSETRGYSALHSGLERTETLIGDVRFSTRR